jgi:hypothetical protein
MRLTRRGLLGSAAVLGSAPIIRARAQSRPVIKLGVLTDLSGTYRDNTGPTSVAAAQLAIEEMKPHLSFDVDLISADHDRTAMVRSGDRCGDRRADVFGGSCCRTGGEGEGQDHAQCVRHGGGADL